MYIYNIYIYIHPSNKENKYVNSIRYFFNVLTMLYGDMRYV